MGLPAAPLIWFEGRTMSGSLARRPCGGERARVTRPRSSASTDSPWTAPSARYWMAKTPWTVTWTESWPPLMGEAGADEAKAASAMGRLALTAGVGPVSER